MIGRCANSATGHRKRVVGRAAAHLGEGLPCAETDGLDSGNGKHMAGDGALLLDETGAVHRIGTPKGKVVNSVGAGDSMVAGFIAGYLQSGSYSYALRLGTACGSATAFSLGLAERRDIDALLKTIE